jgi:hypothetical protein
VLLAGAGAAFAPGVSSYYRTGLPGSLSRRRDERSRRSQFRSIELITTHLSAAEDSPRVRGACADYYQRFLFDFYPCPGELMRLAEARAGKFGGSRLRPEMGPATARLARLLGWKNVWRFKHWLRR